MAIIIAHNSTHIISTINPFILPLLRLKQNLLLFTLPPAVKIAKLVLNLLNTVLTPTIFPLNLHNQPSLLPISISLHSVSTVKISRISIIFIMMMMMMMVMMMVVTVFFSLHPLSLRILLRLLLGLLQILLLLLLQIPPEIVHEIIRLNFHSTLRLYMLFKPLNMPQNHSVRHRSRILTMLLEFLPIIIIT